MLHNVNFYLASNSSKALVWLLVLSQIKGTRFRKYASGGPCHEKRTVIAYVDIGGPDSPRNLLCSPTYGPRQSKMCLRACAKCVDSHYPAHAQSLIRAFVFHWNILYCPMILFAGSEEPDQTAWMRSLIWALLSAYARRHIFALRSNVSIWGQRRPRSDCAHAQARVDMGPLPAYAIWPQCSVITCKVSRLVL